jgi:hypothetical protein
VLQITPATNCGLSFGWMRVTGEHMETTEKIVEVYVRYVRRWATIPEHPTHGRFEISGDRSRYLGRYHIETGISASKVLASDVRFWHKADMG